MQDSLIIGTLLGGGARIYSVSAKAAVEAMRQTHRTLPVCTAALGRTAMGALLLAAMQKGRSESVSLVIKGGGPAGSIVCVAGKGGAVKGYIENPAVDLPLKNGKLDVGGAVGTDGTLSVARESAKGTPYVGKIELVSGEIAEDIASYLMRSEQKESLCYLGVHIERDQSVISAGGIVIQPLPGATDEQISQIAQAVDAVSLFSIMLESDMSHGKILQTLLSALEFELLEEHPCEYKCDCSRERLLRALMNIGAEELRDMIERDKGAEAKCSFCNAVYDFDETELMELYQKAGGRG